MLALSVDSKTELCLLEVGHVRPLYACIEENRDHLRRWMSWMTEAYTEEDCRKFVAQVQERASMREEFHFGLWREGEIMGVVGVHSLQWLIRSGEIGYWLSRKAEGTGIMTRSVKRLLQFLFTDLRLNRIEVRCAASNLKSQAIPRRLGFRFAGVLREFEPVGDRLESLFIYELLQREWKALYEVRTASNSG